MLSDRSPVTVRFSSWQNFARQFLKTREITIWSRLLFYHSSYRNSSILLSEIIGFYLNILNHQHFYSSSTNRSFAVSQYVFQRSVKRLWNRPICLSHVILGSFWKLRTSKSEFWKNPFFLLTPPGLFSKHSRNLSGDYFGQTIKCALRSHNTK